MFLKGADSEHLNHYIHHHNYFKSRFTLSIIWNWRYLKISEFSVNKKYIPGHLVQFLFVCFQIIPDSQSAFSIFIFSEISEPYKELIWHPTVLDKYYLNLKYFFVSDKTVSLPVSSSFIGLLVSIFDVITSVILFVKTSTN